MGRFEKIKMLLVSPLVMWLIVALGAWGALSKLSARELLRESFALGLLILPAALYWLFFFFGALRVHRKAAASVRGIDRLVTEGVYEIVRHPIYSADIVLAWGFFFLFPQLRVLAAVSWLTVVLVGWMVLEERSLSRKFQGEYQEYRRKVPMVVPGKRKK